jgi:hypothetical protein
MSFHVADRRIVFEIFFEGPKEVMVSKLNNVELGVLAYDVRMDIDGEVPEPGTIMCEAILPQNSDQLGIAVDRINSLRGIDGIKQVNFVHVPPPEVPPPERPWFRHPIIPITISTILTFLTVYGTLLGLHVRLNTYDDYFVAFIGPTVTSVLLAILYRFF